MSEEAIGPMPGAPDGAVAKEFPPEFRDKIIAALTERLADSPCPRCANTEFGVMRNMVSFPLGDNPNKITLPGPVLPCAVTYCKRCGFVSFHVLGTLGLLEQGGIKK